MKDLKQLNNILAFVLGITLAVVLIWACYSRACDTPEPTTQSQSQQQDQTQDQSQNQTQANQQSNNQTNVLISPHQIQFPSLIPYYGPHNPGSRYRRVEDMLIYGNEFSLRDLLTNVSERTLRENSIPRVTNDQVLNQTIKVVLVKLPRGQLRGVIGAVAINGCTSADALWTLCLLAFKEGASVVHVTAQGVNPVVRATGGGIGGGGTFGVVSESGTSASSGTGLLGYHKAKTWPDPDPYIQALSVEPLP